MVVAGAAAGAEAESLKSDFSQPMKPPEALAAGAGAGRELADWAKAGWPPVDRFSRGAPP